MATSPFRQRRFSPAEVRRIVKRAAALAEQDPATPETAQSLSQGELEQAAMGLGLPASAIRAAIADQAPEETAEGLAPGGKRRLLFEEELDGEVPADRHEDLVDAIQAVLGDTGRAQVVGKTLTWTPSPTASNQQRKLTITVRARDGKTRIRVDEDLSPQFLGLHLGLDLGIGLGGGVSSVVVGAAAKALLLGVGGAVFLILLSMLAAQLLFNATTRRRSRELKKVMARLREACAEAIRTNAREPTRTRVATEADAQAEAQAEAEADAEAEAEARAEYQGRAT